MPPLLTSLHYPQVGGGYVCTCNLTGHSGRHCEVELNHCDSSKCQNGGTCLDQPGGFLCACSEGFAGINCKKESPRATMITNVSTQYCSSPNVTRIFSLFFSKYEMKPFLVQIWKISLWVSSAKHDSAVCLGIKQHNAYSKTRTRCPEIPLSLSRIE